MTDAAAAAGDPPGLEEPRAAGRPRWPALHVAGVVLVLGALGVALSACRGGEAEPSPLDADLSAAEVRDLSTIVEGAITVEANGDGTATILAVTTIDVVCAVSYGATEALGSLATDSDMAGAGHRDHHPLLVGLEDDTDYFYRLSAIGPDGGLYSTDVATFTTGARSAATPGPNIARGATIADVSSEFSAAFSADRAIDGDRSTEWSSAGDGDDAYIVLDLGAGRDLVGLGFRTREMSDGTAITTSFTVTVDEQPALGPFDAGPGLALASFVANGRVVRIDVETSTGGNTGAVEIEIYAAS